MIVCSCRRVSDRLIQQAVSSGARSSEQVAACTGAGTGCGSCVPALARAVQEAQLRCASAAK